MKTEEATQLIRAMADSIERDRDQFHITVISGGVAGISHGEGPGVKGEAVGGGPGSVTVGTFGHNPSGPVQIEQGNVGRDAANASLDEAVMALRELAQLVEGGASKDTLWARVERMNQLATMPSLVTNVTSVALKLVEMVP